MNQLMENKESSNLLLFINGPLYKLYLILHLVKKPLLLLKRRIVVVCLFAWLPLFLLSLLNGVAFTGAKTPFIYDVDIHVRLLISLALLIYAEAFANDKLRILANHFLQSNLIAAPDRTRFDAIIHSTMRLTKSNIIELLLVILVICVGRQISIDYLPLSASSWYVSQVDGIDKLTLPGYWYAFISLPLFQFILLRWYYRLAIWYRFLWQVSRLPLQLNSLHPDRAGGLGFLAYSVNAILPFALAHSVLLAGMIFNRIWNDGAVISQFQSEMLCLIIFLIILLLTPLFFFMFSLAKIKRKGTLEYAVVANEYISDFSKKWINASPKTDMLGNSDFQSLADLGNSFQVSAQMRVFPFDRSTILLIIIAAALPFLPLVFTIIPFNKILQQTLGLLF